MAALVGPLIVLAGFGLYMASNTLLGRFRRVPWEFLAVSAFGVVLAAAFALRDGGAAAVVATALSALLFGLLVLFYLRFSMYGPREDRPRVGDRFPDFRLPTSDGGVFDLAERRGQRHLLIFYRGSW